MFQIAIFGQVFDEGMGCVVDGVISTEGEDGQYFVERMRGRVQGTTAFQTNIKTII